MTKSIHMLKNKLTKRAFTIVELVIVIAVIAILAAVLIPTFSGVVQKANQSAALQTARSALTNALNMSDKARLEGKDADGNFRTVILVGDYAFGYDGGELGVIDFPGTDGAAIQTLTYGTNYNAILINAEDIGDDGTLKEVSDSLLAATDMSGSVSIVEVDGDKYATDGNIVCAVYTNPDLAAEAIVLTTFAGTISDTVIAEVKAQAGTTGYTTKASGKGSSINFNSLN